LIGCSKAQAVNYRAVLNAPNEIKQLILENKIKNLEKAALISDVEHSPIREHLIFACLDGTSLKKLKVIAQQSIRMSKQKIAQTETRGRQSTTINLGTTKSIQVARLILRSVLKNDELSHVASYFKDIDSSDPKQISRTFKELLIKLEELQ